MMGIVAIGRSRCHAMDFLIGLDALCLIIIRNILNEGDGIHNAHHQIAAAYVKNGNVMTAAVILQCVVRNIPGRIDCFTVIFFCLWYFVQGGADVFPTRSKYTIDSLHHSLDIGPFDSILANFISLRLFQHPRRVHIGLVHRSIGGIGDVRAFDLI